MKKSGIKVLTTAMAILMALATFGAMFLTMMAMIDRSGDRLMDIVLVVKVLVSLFGTYYLAVGFSKEKGAELFKAYLWSYAAACVCLFLNEAARASTAAIVVGVAQFAALCILAVAKDLGEVKSKLLGAFVTVLALVQTVIQIRLAGEVTAETCMGYVIDVVLGLSVFVLICAKYAEKKARGRK